jgi:type I restriction-modification system DNA methylase subunit
MASATAPRSRRRAATTRLDFAAIEIVGALLSPDMAARIAAGDTPSQTAASYGIPDGLQLRDEIARYFRIGEALWNRFSVAAASNPDASARFITDLLRQCLGFTTLQPTPPVQLAERTFPLGHAALGGRVPVVIAPAPAANSRKSGVDESLTHFGDGARRRSATLLVQDYLNATDHALWGIAADGHLLRLLRDNVSMTRPAWIEINLARIFTEGLFSDFSVFWLLLHQSRFGHPDALVSDCSLEQWRERGKTDGETARANLRNGVETALVELGCGFLEPMANQELRHALATGALTVQQYYEELLRLVYRLIFLFVTEDRGLLHTSSATARARKNYEEGYSLNRLRERCMRRAAWDRHQDAWEGIKAAHAALSRGEEQLGLPALGGLFASGALPHLENATLENRRLLAAVWRLSWLRGEGEALTRVNWRDMETEEFGSVYESLLELVPRLSLEQRAFHFVGGEEGRGSARKTSGSYYTPEVLVKVLLDRTLDPVLDAAETRNPADAVEAILRLAIIDPACGSGHFLLGAARRAANRIARLRSPGAPSQTEFQHALREVVSRSIYGVDRNPMAVELCKVALWIEATETDRPLAFLDSHIRCGDSLVGVFSYDMLKAGIPDEAYKPLTGDDKDVAKSYGRFNKQGRSGKVATGLFTQWLAPVAVLDGAKAVLAMPENTLAEVQAKQTAFQQLLHSEKRQQLKQACDAYVAAFFASKAGTVPDPANLDTGTVPLTEHLWTAVRGIAMSPALANSVADTASHISAFHWPLEFPQVFAVGGFDAVIGNPPWERIKLQEQEYFAARSPEIATAANKAARDVLIRQLAIAPQDSHQGRLYAEFVFAKRAAEAASEFARNSGRFPLTGTGDVNTYALFAEHFANLASPRGRAGVIVPTGIATDSSTSAFFGHLIAERKLAGLVDFENREKLFPAVDSRMKFCVLSLGQSERAQFAFFLTNAQHLDDTERHFSLTADEIARINPNTKTAPVFRSKADAELTKKIYSRVPVLLEERPEEHGGDVNPWGISFQRMFDMANDSNSFRTIAQLEKEGWTREGTDWIREEKGTLEWRVPLYEAKMIHHYDHRWATYAGGSTADEEGSRDCTLAEKQDPNYEPTPRYWVPEDEVHLRAARVPATLKRAYRDGDEDRCLKAMVDWLMGYYLLAEGRPAKEREIVQLLGPERNWRAVLGTIVEKYIGDPKVQPTAKDCQRTTPLTPDDLLFLKQAPQDPIELAAAILERKQPRWLMGWRDICRSTDERTVIGGVFPRCGVGNNLPVWYPGGTPVALQAVFAAMLSSFTFDFSARHKVGGTHLNFFIAQQLPAVPPQSFSRDEVAFVTARLLELTYTSHQMKPFATDLGSARSPFPWDLTRRALLRSELDVFFARKYGLTRDELRYILDPATVKGPGYPSETFRVLQKNEQRDFGEYRTQRLIMEAWDRLGNI